MKGDGPSPPPVVLHIHDKAPARPIERVAIIPQTLFEIERLIVDLRERMSRGDVKVDGAFIRRVHYAAEQLLALAPLRTVN